MRMRNLSRLTCLFCSSDKAHQRRLKNCSALDIVLRSTSSGVVPLWWATVSATSNSSLGAEYRRPFLGKYGASVSRSSWLVPSIFKALIASPVKFWTPRFTLKDVFGNFFLHQSNTTGEPEKQWSCILCSLWRSLRMLSNCRWTSSPLLDLNQS